MLSRLINHRNTAHMVIIEYTHRHQTPNSQIGYFDSECNIFDYYMKLHILAILTARSTR